MFYTIEKLEARMKELNPYRYMERKSLNNWKAKESIEGAEKYPPSISTEWQDFSLGDIWEGRDYYLWIQTTFKVPKSDGRIVLLLDFGRTGGGYNSGFESLLLWTANHTKALTLIIKKSFLTLVITERK